MIIGLVVVGLIALIAYATSGQVSYRVKVCMSYQDRKACKTVSGRDEQSTMRAAIDGACADIASGVTETLGCTKSDPASTEWLRRPTAN